MQTALKKMKKGRVPGIDEVCTEMIIVVKEVGVIWTKMLSNVCMRERIQFWRIGGQS